jgi:hypothetical protein
LIFGSFGLLSLILADASFSPFAASNPVFDVYRYEALSLIGKLTPSHSMRWGYPSARLGRTNLRKHWFFEHIDPARMLK